MSKVARIPLPDSKVVYIALNIERKVLYFFYEFPCIFERLVLEGGDAVKTVDGG
jgi:hypothetical protein